MALSALGVGFDHSAFAQSEGLDYELIIARKGEHVHEKVLHIQNVTSYMSGLKKWPARFNGVATKYLQNDLGWRRMLEESGGNRLNLPCRPVLT